MKPYISNLCQYKPTCDLFPPPNHTQHNNNACYVTKYYNSQPIHTPTLTVTPQWQNTEDTHMLQLADYYLGMDVDVDGEFTDNGGR